MGVPGGAQRPEHAERRAEELEAKLQKAEKKIEQARAEAEATRLAAAAIGNGCADPAWRAACVSGVHGATLVPRLFEALPVRRSGDEDDDGDELHDEYHDEPHNAPHDELRDDDDDGYDHLRFTIG